MPYDLSSTIVPMEPRPAAEPFDDPAYVYQVKWDGVRMLAFVGPQGVRLQNRRLRDRTRHYPELTALARLCRGPAILDGEVIVLHGGKPSFPRVLRRDLAGPDQAARLMDRLPITYMVFDLLLAGDADLSGAPLAARQERLREWLRPADGIELVEDFSAGRALFAAVKEQGLEGIVAKRRASPYVEGKKTSYWLKIKYRRRIHCAVGGCTYKEGHFSALLLGLYHPDGRLVYVGRAGSGLTGEQARQLDRYFRANATAGAPFASPPRLYGVEVVWCRPELVCVVEYQEWTEELGLRAPVVVGFSDRPAAECVLE